MLDDYFKANPWVKDRPWLGIEPQSPCRRPVVVAKLQTLATLLMIKIFLMGTTGAHSARAALRDFKCRVSRDMLNKECKHATPIMWHRYATSSLIIKCLRDGSPQLLTEEIKLTLHTQRRTQHQGRFYDNSKGKVSRHHIGNRVTFMNDLKFDWLNLDTDLSDNAIRIELKKHLNFDFKNNEILWIQLMKKYAP